MSDVLSDAAKVVRDHDLCRLIHEVFDDADIVAEAVLAAEDDPELPETLEVLYGTVYWSLAAPVTSTTRRMLVCALVAELKGD